MVKMFERFKNVKRRREIPDSEPAALPVGFVRPPTLHEQMAMFMRSERFRLSGDEAETFEESMDFDAEEDGDDQLFVDTRYQEAFKRSEKLTKELYPVVKAGPKVNPSDAPAGAPAASKPAKGAPAPSPKD